MTTERCVCFYENGPPCPFCAEDNRDLHADLAICEAATVGPWIYSDWPGSVNVVTPSRRIITSVYGMDAHEANARGIFIAAARTGWPHAIERALAAEALVKSHGPDGRNYTNREYVETRERAAKAEAEVKQLREELEHIRSLANEFDYMAIVDHFDAKEATE